MPFLKGAMEGMDIQAAPTSFFVETFTADQNLISPAAKLFWQTNWNG